MVFNRMARIITYLGCSLILLGWGSITHASTVYIVAPNGEHQTIESALDVANEGDTIEVHGGVYPAPLYIEKSVTLLGIDNPVIDGVGKGSLVIITAPDVHLEGFTIRNSGISIITEDTGIVVQASNVNVVNNRVEDVLYGIYFAAADGGIAQGNYVRCHDLEISRRGDGMRVWYSKNILLDSNTITNCRDTLIWYTDGIIIQNNMIDSNLYGLHFMYSDNATIQNNTISNNSVGIYMMYSETIIATDNSILWNRGASGYGIAFKDSNYISVENNAIIGNQSGLYIDNSPMLPDVITLFKGNFFAYNDIGVSALPSVARNAFQSNAFIDNIQQASTLGRGDLLKNMWQVDGIGNYWSDYVGYDSDGDGVGDVPYRVEKLFESLTDEYPLLRLFTYSPASQSLNFAASAFPSLRPDPKVIDEAPLMHYTIPAQIAQTNTNPSGSFLAVSLILLGLGGAICLFTLYPVHLKLTHDQTQGAE